MTILNNNNDRNRGGKGGGGKYHIVSNISITQLCTFITVIAKNRCALAKSGLFENNYLINT